MGEFSPFHWIVFLFILVVTYFIPAIVGRKKRNAAAIFFLNLFLGWTVAGWIVALIWALTKDSETPQVIVNQPAQPALSSVLCTQCGKYSPSGTKFCGMCGAAMNNAGKTQDRPTASIAK